MQPLVSESQPRCDIGTAPQRSSSPAGDNTTPSHPASRKASYSSSSSSELDCILCYDSFVEPVTLPCGHTFCRNCLIETLQSLEKRCPHCRADCSAIDPYGVPVSYVLQAILSKDEAYASKVAAAKRQRQQWRRAFPVFCMEQPIFPGHPVRLLLFEPRYKIMAHRLTHSDRRFLYCCGDKPRDSSVATLVTLTTVRFMKNGCALVEGRSSLERYTLTDVHEQPGTHELYYATPQAMPAAAADASTPPGEEEQALLKTVERWLSSNAAEYVLPPRPSTSARSLLPSHSLLRWQHGSNYAPEEGKEAKEGDIAPPSSDQAAKRQRIATPQLSAAQERLCTAESLCAEILHHVAHQIWELYPSSRRGKVVSLYGPFPSEPPANKEEAARLCYWGAALFPLPLTLRYKVFQSPCLLEQLFSVMRVACGCYDSLACVDDEADDESDVEEP